jgi:FkbH-like protein
MEKIKNLINECGPITFNDHIILYEKIRGDINERTVNFPANLKVAILSSFTIKGLDKVLFVKSVLNGIKPEIYLGDYNQYNQEMLDPNSRLYQFEPDIIFIFIDTRALVGELFLNPYSSISSIKEIVNEKIDELTDLVKTVKQRTSAKIVIHNFEVPVYSSLGILENKQEDGMASSIRRLNDNLEEAYRNDNQVLVFDYEAFCSRHGKDNLINYKLYYLADIKLDLQYLPHLCEEYLGYLIPLGSLTKKCLVLDLDNTLWGGIVGEDGMSGIKLGPTPEGRSFYEFQHYIRSLHDKGIILAINSRNNPDDAKEVIRNHPYMVLKEENFAAERINWNDKASNLRALADDLNIGLDSMIFVDDDELNREIVKNELPQVKVVDLPKDSSLYLKTLMELKDLNVFRITEEDKNKGRMYLEQKMRREQQSKYSDIEDYIKSLQMEISIEKMSEFNRPRISQLTQKTNQFNLTTKRYLEEDLKTMKIDGYLIFAVNVRDKFGDNGLTGVFIVKPEDESLIMDSLLLSCRIIGRKVENVIMGHIYDLAKKMDKRLIIGHFIPTQKNIPSRDFFKDNGFSGSSGSNIPEEWVYHTERPYPKIDYIKLTVK